MIREALQRLIDHSNLSTDEAAQVMTEIMDGDATQSQTASFLTALRMKGETVDEVLGFVRVMRDKSMHVRIPDNTDVVDTCGTGGDKLNTFNISTTAAFVAAGAGIKIAKHGNRAASSKCGSADVLEALGINLTLSAEQVAECINKVGIGFMFAQTMHPAMRHAGTPRKEMGIRTIFNLLGPMTNPANASRQVLGVFSPDYTELVADVLRKLGTKHAMVFHGLDGLDEISTVGPTKISELNSCTVNTYEIDCTDFGIKHANTDDLAAGDGSVEANADALLSVLNGETGPKRDIVLINASAALVVNDNAADFNEGLEIAARSIDSGAAIKKLNDLVELCSNLTEAIPA